jgi:hypothetical protein
LKRNPGPDRAFVSNRQSGFAGWFAGQLDFMTMAYAILVAIIAGVTTALMSGLLTPGAMPAVFLSLLAPAPLFIAGFGWHPLVAALGGLVAVLIGHFAVGAPASVMISGMIALPAFGLTFLSERLFGAYAGRPDKDGVDLGRLFVTLVLYIGIAGVTAALIFEPDYARLEQRIRTAVEAVFILTGLEKAMPNASKDDIARLLGMMTSIMLPMSALISLLTLVISGTLGVQIADRAKRMTFPRPDFRRFRLPGGVLILLGMALIASTRDGYLGLLGEVVALGLVFGYLLQGLAVVHTRTLGMGGRGLILVVTWGALVLFGIPAFIFIGIGMADHLLDFRRGRL